MSFRFASCVSVFAAQLAVVGPSYAQDHGRAKAERDEDAAHELDELIVEGKLVERDQPAPSTAARLDDEELVRQESDNIQQILVRVPGVQVRGEDGLGLRPNIGIRGTSPNRSAKVTLLEDGVLLAPAPYSAPAAYYFPLVTRMDEIVVEKGGASLRYGPRALGGAINLKTAQIRPGWGALGDVAYGQYGYFKGHGRLGYANERTGFLLEAARISSTGFKELDGGGNTGFDKSEFMAKWRLNSAPDAKIYQQLDAKFGYSSEVSNETYVGLSDSDFSRDPYRRYVSTELDRMRWHRGLSQLSYTVLPSNSTEVVVTAYRNQFTRDWFKLDAFDGASLDSILQSPDTPANRIYYDVLTGRENTTGAGDTLLLVDNYRWYVSQGVNARLEYVGVTGPIDHHLSTSLGFHYDEVNRRHDHVPYGMVGASSDTLGHIERLDEPRRVLTRNKGQAYAISANLVDTLEHRRWTWTPGVRFELVMSEFSDQVDPNNDNTMIQAGVTPGAGIHYSITDELGVLAGIYRGFGPSSAQARAASSAVPAPEQSTNYEWGGRWSSESLFLEAVGYLNDYQNLTGECSESRGCSAQDVGRQFSGGRVLVGGLEVGFETRPTYRNFEFPIRLGYALTKSRFLTSFSSDNPEWGRVEKGYELPYLPTHQASGSINATHSRFGEFGISTTVVSAAREVAGSGEINSNQRTDPYALLNLNLRVDVIEELSVYAVANNVLGAQYLTSRRPHGARPGAPRWIQVGVKFEY